MSAALILVKQVNRGGANTLPLRLHFPPQSPRRVSTERAEAGPDRVAVCVCVCVCDVFRVQQQRERSAASVMTRPGKRSFQAALIFLSVAQLTAGRAGGDRGQGRNDRRLWSETQQHMEAGVGLTDFHNVSFFHF